MGDRIASLEEMLAKGSDSAMLRFGLGKAYLDAGRGDEAVRHLRAAVQLQSDYSAAWKLLGKALSEGGDSQGAIDAYRQGIAIAEGKGDIQAAKEMKVFLKRLEKGAAPST